MKFIFPKGRRFHMLSLEQMVGLRVFSMELGAVTKIQKANVWCAGAGAGAGAGAVIGAESWKLTHECP